MPYCLFAALKTSQSNDGAGSRQHFLSPQAATVRWLFVLFDWFHLGQTHLSLMSCSYSLILSDDGSRAWCFVFVCFGLKVHFRFLRWSRLQKDGKYPVMKCRLVLV